MSGPDCAVADEQLKSRVTIEASGDFGLKLPKLSSPVTFRRLRQSTLICTRGWKRAAEFKMLRLARPATAPLRRQLTQAALYQVCPKNVLARARATNTFHSGERSQKEMMLC